MNLLDKLAHWLVNKLSPRQLIYAMAGICFTAGALWMCIAIKLFG